MAISELTNGWPLFIIAFGAGALLYYILYRITKFIAARRGTPASRFAVDKLRYPALAVFVLASLIVVFNNIKLSPRATNYLNHLIEILLVFTIAWISVSLVHISRTVILGKHDITARDNLKARKRLTQFKVLERVVNGMIILTAVSVALMTFETIREVGVSLLASAGVLGIILGLAAQKSLGTLIAGIQIAITQPIRIDDAVIVEDEWGWIEEITFTYVVIRIWDKRRLIVPINYFIEQPFQNWTHTSSDILGSVFIRTDYTVPVDAIRKELDRILEETDLWDGKVKVVQVTDMTEKAMETRVLVSAEDSPTAWDLRVHVREKLVEFLQKNYPGSLPQARIILNDDKKDFIREEL